MKKNSSLLFALLLILPQLICPVLNVQGSQTSYDSEQGQAVVAPPSDGAAGQTEEGAGTDVSAVDWEAANTAESPAREDSLIVVVDPGHQGSWVDMSAPEPVAPGSTETKAKATTGTQGSFSGIPEYEVNLQVAVALEKELHARGYHVVMTRTDNDKAISNKERAEVATRTNADITVRIHANGSDDSGASGALTMAPTSSNAYLDPDIIEKSNTLASCILNRYCAATGLQNLGVISADNMTGTNWSTVPVAILEMGFMSNQNDDLYITSTSNHTLMAQSIADGIDEYFSIVKPETAAAGEHLSDLTEKLETEFIAPGEEAGESWAVAVTDPATADYSTIHADKSIPSASAVKVFIMGAVYEQLAYGGDSGEVSADYESVLQPLLTQMIAQDSCDAANELIRLLGQGDFSSGVSAVNEFCRVHNYSSTHLEKELRDGQLPEENYTSAADCCRILTDVYNGTLVNASASGKMLDLLNQRTDACGNASFSVVEGSRPYVICILAEKTQDDSSFRDTADRISSAVSEYMASGSQKADNEGESANREDTSKKESETESMSDPAQNTEKDTISSESDSETSEPAVPPTPAP